ncbi:helix-turn-helix domain-containing protein [Selenomonas sp.]|uniref:helix-turn-helix domain-containing protein n=1 Tax=Selenomonas sp. TaxID=2053611 RepID=UPI0025CD7C93|nr:helix-turn-helix domain-containing protein [Selenomonas sp.]MBQ1867894.1 helix-turn-helix domain-containing protein [Selenomonas sp.]
MSKMSFAASEILEGLNEALQDAKGIPVEGVKKTVVYQVKPKEVREHLNMTQQEFSKAFGIPLATLRNWEQGRRKIDATAASYLRAILRYPREIMAAQS